VRAEELHEEETMISWVGLDRNSFSKLNKNLLFNHNRGAEREIQ